MERTRTEAHCRYCYEYWDSEAGRCRAYPGYCSLDGGPYHAPKNPTLSELMAHCQHDVETLDILVDALEPDADLYDKDAVQHVGNAATYMLLAANELRQCPVRYELHRVEGKVRNL